MLRFLRTTKEETPDAELLARFQTKSDQQALAVLFDRYLELIYGLCMQYLKTPVRAEDATLAIYVELARKLPEHEVKNFKNWLYTFIRNHCLMQLRKEKKMITINYDGNFMHSNEELHPVEDVQEKEERFNALDYCLEQLNEQQKVAVQLFYYQGHSYKDIAVMRNEEVGRVRSNIQNGRRNLKNCIEEQEKLNS
jgi:RNA polymerase sigma-70 factor (ECF subfamily)